MELVTLVTYDHLKRLSSGIMQMLLIFFGVSTPDACIDFDQYGNVLLALPKSIFFKKDPILLLPL